MAGMSAVSSASSLLETEITKVQKAISEGERRLQVPQFALLLAKFRAQRRERGAVRVPALSQRHDPSVRFGEFEQGCLEG